MTPCIYFESRTEFLTWYGVWRLVILFFPGGWTVFCLAAIFIRMGYFLYPHGHKCTARIIQGFTKFKPCFLLPPGKFNCKQVLLLTWALEPPYCHISLRPSVKHRARWASYKKSESLLPIKELQDFDWFWNNCLKLYIYCTPLNLKISWYTVNVIFEVWKYYVGVLFSWFYPTYGHSSNIELFPCIWPHVYLHGLCFYSRKCVSILPPLFKLPPA